MVLSGLGDTDGLTALPRGVLQLERVYKRSELGPALRTASVRGFSLRSATLVVFFRLQLDRRRTTT